MSSQENYEYNQLIFRRREAYDQHHMLEKELKTLRTDMHELDKKLEQTHPNEIADVQHEMGRIGFIQSELDDGLNEEAVHFAENELAVRFEKLFEKLRSMTKVGGSDWGIREVKTIRMYEVQQAVIKKRDEIVNLDHAYFSSIEYQEANPVTPPPDIDDDVFEKWMEESQLSDKEIHEYDREAWTHEKTWMEIGSEAQERAIAELKEQKISADDFEQRMRAALKLETEIEAVRQNLQSAVRKLQRVQEQRKKAIQDRIALQDTIQSKTKEYNSRIKYLEDYFDMIIPTGIWPDYIIGKTSEAYDPVAAEVLLEEIKRSQSADEQTEFWRFQGELRQLREEQRSFNRDSRERSDELHSLMDKGVEEEEQLRATVISLRDELNMKNGMRAAELQVALPRIKVLGEDDLELDPPKPPQSSTTDVGDGFMHWTAIDQSARVIPEGVSATGETGKVQEASASITVGFNAEAKAEVYQKKQDNDAGEEEITKQLEGVDANGAIVRAYQNLMAQSTIAFDPNYRADDDDPEDKKNAAFKKAVDLLNAQHHQGELVHKTIVFQVTGNTEKVQKVRKMLAFRCGFNLHKDRTITCEVMARSDPTGNTIAVYFPKSRTTGMISVYAMPSGDWRIHTAKNQFPDWVNWSQNTPGVPPMAKNANHTIPEYLGFYRLIQKRINDYLDEIREPKKKATG